MKIGFQERTLITMSSDGRDDVLQQPLHFRSHDGTLYRVPEWATTDGMSTPPMVRAIPGFEPYGAHWFSAILHDAAYRGSLETIYYTNFVPAMLSRKAADELLDEALETQGIPEFRRLLIYTALRLFGGRNFNPHPTRHAPI